MQPGGRVLGMTLAFTRRWHFPPYTCKTRLEPERRGGPQCAVPVAGLGGKGPEKYDPAIEDFYRKEIEVDSSSSVLELLDTAVTEQFASMWDLYIKNGQDFILVYGLVNQQSFQDIKPMRDQIIRVKRYEKVPVILVGNKVDLESEREVSSHEGRALAEEWGCPFMETSAKSKTTGGRTLQKS
ncbi:Ras-related protein Rap-2a [Sciurus carolinensis]|uniref:Ras-related protein Rap-2a n=1 Tax=Sciurus carolinensis TaxID=30640 RepID=A0AA41T4S3_SCICA|nr:Ras-related protein Rap-2a [Sciurus carolinensis]